MQQGGMGGNDCAIAYVLERRQRRKTPNMNMDSFFIIELLEAKVSVASQYSINPTTGGILLQ
jgi:hypothetical protein